MTVINSNTNALFAQDALAVNGRSMANAMEQLSTGLRINGAGDDAAGLAISSRMTSQIKGLDQAVRNAGDAISLLETAEGAQLEVEGMLQRMRELALQSASDSYASADRTALNLEFAALGAEITRIAAKTTWNGINILNATGGSSGAYAFQVGPNASDTVSITIASVASSNTAAAGNISSTTAAQTAIAALDTDLATVASQRATIGSVVNRLQHTVDNLSNISSNTAASRSRIQDTDYAKATSELARTQIIQQAATAMLAQANQQPASVLSLLQ